MINTRWNRWVFLAPLVMLATGMGNVCQGEATQLPRKGPSAAPGTPQVECINEHLTVKAKSVTLEQMLDGIAKACHLKIHSASAEKSRTLISAEFTDIALADALGEMLRGCDYLVVYNESLENTGFTTSMAPVRSANNQDAVIEDALSTDENEANEPVLDERQEQIVFIQNQMRILNDRIVSGESDQIFEEAIKIKPAEFVQNDRELLANYQNKLEEIEQQ